MSVHPTPLNSISIIFAVLSRAAFVGSGAGPELTAGDLQETRKPRTWWSHFIANISAHPLDPLSARGSRLEGIAEVLGLTGNLPVSELHNTHCVRRRAVVCKDEFSDPKVGSTEYALDLKALLVRLRKTRCLNIAPTA